MVGDVIGKYHPHGDQSVYDAMVRLAQDFALRYPLVDGQGNFGNIDGDNAAAYRYTEARLTAIATQLMAGLDEGTVDFRPTYNGEEEEPEVFPGLFPNLLANGASGIAVGMATSIPPHNLGELVDAAIDLIDDPKVDDRALLQHVAGPDFPTGGVLVDDEDTIARAYVSGRGSFRLRAKIEVEREKGGGWHLLVSEIPYGVPKAKLIEQIAQLIADKKLPILADVKDESDEQVRLILEPRARTVDPELLLESLFRLTDLEIRFPLNLNVLDATPHPGRDEPQGSAAAWLAFQFEVLVRRSQVRIGKIDDRLELLDGFLIAYLNLDRVIEIIRTEDEPKPVLMAEFSLSDRQAEAILNMRLRSLAPARGNGDRQGARGACEGARGAREADREPGSPAHSDEARPVAPLKDKFGDERRTRIEAAARRSRDRLVGDDREGADHGHPVAARLDPGDEGASRARPGRRPQVARGRRAVHPLPRPDNRPAGAVRLERPGLHACRRQAAERARLRRAGAAVHRPRCRGRDRPAARRAARDEAAGRLVRRARASSPAAKRRSPKPARASNWSTSAREPRVAVVASGPGRCRRGRGRRREPQDGGLPARPSCPSSGAGRA